MTTEAVESKILHLKEGKAKVDFDLASEKKRKMAEAKLVEAEKAREG